MLRDAPLFVRLRGFSLLEVLVSAFILSILSVSVIHGLTTLEIESRLAKDRTRSALLAADLREEILSKASVDPDGDAVLGREPGESGSDRISYDDQDDYHGLTDRPASDIRGMALPGMDRIWRVCRVESVSAARPEGKAVDTNPLGLRRFTVSIYKDQIELAHLMWLGVGQGR